MFRKLTLALAAIAIAASAMVSVDAQAKPNKPNGQIKIIKPLHPKPHLHGHRHIRPVYVVERSYVRPVMLSAPVRSICTCLTKEYTPEGTVVFKDLCTKEMASAPVEGAPMQSSEAQSPQNFAGKTYQDFLAANGKDDQSATQKN